MLDYNEKLFDPAAPLAIAVIRNPEDGKVITDVPMLIDSGADVSLIPAELIKPLGLSEGLYGKYELMAFDGSVINSQAVQVEFLFLRRTFKGRFLLTNQNYGIIGRDILNHISLWLDGPNLRWSELKSQAPTNPPVRK